MRPWPVASRALRGVGPNWRTGAHSSANLGDRDTVPSPVAPEVSAPDGYGFLDLITSEDGTGIRGGVGGGPGYESHAVFYIGVPDVGAALQRAEDLGGTRVMGPVSSPNGLVVGHFKDPEGTLIGVAGPA